MLQLFKDGQPYLPYLFTLPPTYEVSAKMCPAILVFKCVQGRSNIVALSVFKCVSSPKSRSFSQPPNRSPSLFPHA